MTQDKLQELLKLERSRIDWLERHYDEVFGYMAILVATKGAARDPNINLRTMADEGMRLEQEEAKNGPAKSP